MRKHIGIWLIALALWAGSVTVSLADFQAGMGAYKSGDYKTAFREFKSSADQGDATAQFILGFLYFHGQGVAQDYKEAVKWYRMLAEQGVALGQYNIGQMYRRGQGVAQDYKEAENWYRKAAKQGHASAQYHIGTIYRKGLGVLSDNMKAHMWFNIAGANGLELGAEKRVEIEKEMTPAQIAEAQKLAREWMQKHQ